jgi:hypothetical protein
MDGSSTRNSVRNSPKNVVTGVVVTGGVAFVTDFLLVVVVPIFLILLPLLVEVADEYSVNDRAAVLLHKLLRLCRCCFCCIAWMPMKITSFRPLTPCVNGITDVIDDCNIDEKNNCSNGADFIMGEGGRGKRRHGAFFVVVVSFQLLPRWMETNAAILFRLNAVATVFL